MSSQDSDNSRASGTVKSYIERKHEKLDKEHLGSPNFQMVQVHHASILHHEHYLSLCFNMTPYEAVFHMKAKRELLDHDLEEGPGKQKSKEIKETQESYNSNSLK